MFEIFNTNWKRVQLLQSETIFVRDRAFWIYMPAKIRTDASQLICARPTLP